LLTRQIDVENPDKNYWFSNIESTATCKHHMQEMTVCYCRERIVDDRKVKIVTFIIKFGCQGSINVMFEVKVRVGSRVSSFIK